MAGAGPAQAAQAGAVLTGIGALLAAVDLVAIYQFGGLAGQIDLDVYWLGSAILCTAVYALTAWRLPTDFFGYITLIGLHNLVLALARVLGLSWEWQIASQAALAAGQVEAAFRLARGPERWHMLARVARWWPLLLLPVAQILVLIVPGQPALGQMVVFVLAALGYGLLAWRFPRAAFAHVAAWSAIPAVALALRAASLPAGWYGAVAALLAPLYGLAGRWIGRRMKAEQPAGEPLARRYAAAADGAGFGLVALAASWSASSPPR